MPRAPRFSRKTLDFIEKASRQKKADWLERNRDEYEECLLAPMRNLARVLKSRVAPHANGYHFPQKALARLKRSAHRAEETGTFFRDWVSYSAARPRVSRFEHNPNFFFLLQPGEEDGDEILLAGGLYMPSSRQLRALRESVAGDAARDFDRLFASKPFKSRFPGGFSFERASSRVPRGFDKDHPRLKWIQLQAFFVWRSYSIREFSSPEFAELIASDCRQIARMNDLIDRCVGGLPSFRRLAVAEKPADRVRPGLTATLEGVEAPRRKMDF